MTPTLRILLFIALAFPSILSAQEDYKSPALGATFPAKLANMSLVHVEDYEKQSPGLGTGLSYRAEKEKADLYIYNNGFRTIPEGVDSPEIQTQFKEVIDEIFEMEKQAYYLDVKVDVPMEKVEIGGRPFLHAQLQFTQKGKPFTFHVYLTVLKNQFFKIRYTYLASDEEEGKKTLETLLSSVGMALSPTSQ